MRRITNNDKSSSKSKKHKTWITYVDEEQDERLKTFMNEYEIKNTAKLIRNVMSMYINAVKLIQKKNQSLEEYSHNKIGEIIRKALLSYDLKPNLYEEIKQKLSPLKTLILLLNQSDIPSQKYPEVTKDINNAFSDLEKTILNYYEEPLPERHVKTFDILHIEDNELERKTIGTYFKHKNIDIRSVETSEEALDILKKNTPKLILLDLNLKTSDISGEQFSKLIKSNDSFKSIPIVVMSAVISKSKKHQLTQNLPIDEIILKPIDKLKDLDLVLNYID